MPYTFDQIFAVDPASLDVVASDSQVVIFAPGDVARKPLPITDNSGLPLSNPIKTNEHGFGPAFIAELDRVAWEGGGLTGFLTSYEGIKNEAIAAGDMALSAQEAAGSAAASSQASAVSAAASAQLVMAPADEAVAAMVRAQESRTTAALQAEMSTGGTALNRAIRDLTPADILTNAYRKKVVAKLAYQHAGWAAASAKWGSLYPQCFAIDPVADEIFVISQAPKIVSVYTFSTGQYKSVFCLQSAGSAEGAVIRYQNGSRYLYCSHGPGNLGQWDITTLPANLSEPAPYRVISNLDIQNNVEYRNGIWTMGSKTQTAGPSYTLHRGMFSRYDENFNQIGMLELPSILSGGNSGRAYAASVIPKYQGFCEGNGVFALGIGGGWEPGKPHTPYHYQGIRVFNGNGGVLVDSLVTGSGMLQTLTEAGYHPALIENEGVQFVDGKFYSLYATHASGSAYADSEGILIFEEFSRAADALDFSEHAATWTTVDTRLASTSNHPRAMDGKLHNRVTWEALDTLSKIFDYMLDMEQPRFHFYSSDVAVTDVDGKQLPAGYFVEVIDANHGTFFVRLVGGGEILYRYTWGGSSWVRANSKTTYTDFNIQGPLIGMPSEPNQWGYSDSLVTLNVAVKAATGNIPTGNTVIAELGTVLPEKLLPSGNRNLLLVDQDGKSIRLLLTATGRLQIGTTTTTHAYAVGQVHYRP